MVGLTPTPLLANHGSSIIALNYGKVRHMTGTAKVCALRLNVRTSIPHLLLSRLEEKEPKRSHTTLSLIRPGLENFYLAIR